MHYTLTWGNFIIFMLSYFYQFKVSWHWERKDFDGNDGVDWIKNRGGETVPSIESLILAPTLGI